MLLPLKDEIVYVAGAVDGQRRAKLIRQIARAGGQFRPQMADDVSIVVVGEPNEVPKRLKSKVVLVSPQFVLDAEPGTALDKTDYLVDRDGQSVRKSDDSMVDDEEESTPEWQVALAQLENEEGETLKEKFTLVSNAIARKEVPLDQVVPVFKSLFSEKLRGLYHLRDQRQKMLPRVLTALVPLDKVVGERLQVDDVDALCQVTQLVLQSTNGDRKTLPRRLHPRVCALALAQSDDGDLAKLQEIQMCGMTLLIRFFAKLPRNVKVANFFLSTREFELALGGHSLVNDRESSAGAIWACANMLDETTKAAMLRRVFLSDATEKTAHLFCVLAQDAQFKQLVSAPAQETVGKRLREYLQWTGSDDAVTRRFFDRLVRLAGQTRGTSGTRASGTRASGTRASGTRGVDLTLLAATAATNFVASALASTAELDSLAARRMQLVFFEHEEVLQWAAEHYDEYGLRRSLFQCNKLFFVLLRSLWDGQEVGKPSLLPHVRTVTTVARRLLWSGLCEKPSGVSDFVLRFLHVAPSLRAYFLRKLSVTGKDDVCALRDERLKLMMRYADEDLVFELADGDAKWTQSQLEKTLADTPFVADGSDTGAFTLSYRSGNNEWVQCDVTDTTQVEAMLLAGTPSGFGMGEQHVFDESYRKARHFVAEDFKLEFDLTSICRQIGAQLALPRHSKKASVRAECYRLNLYGEGGHFKAHVDTPKPGSVGTLVLCLPSLFAGGHFRVGRGDPQALADGGFVGEHCRSYEDWGGRREGGKQGGKTRPLHWTAFFGDCAHAVSPPVRDGVRVTVTFDLYLSDRTDDDLTDGDHTDHTDDHNDGVTDEAISHVAALLQQLLLRPDTLPVGGIMLYACHHRYPKNLFQGRELTEVLHGADRVLFQAARSLGLEPTLRQALLTADPETRKLQTEYYGGGESVDQAAFLLPADKEDEPYWSDGSPGNESDSDFNSDFEDQGDSCASFLEQHFRADAAIGGRTMWLRQLEGHVEACAPGQLQASAHFMFGNFPCSEVLFYKYGVLCIRADGALQGRLTRLARGIADALYAFGGRRFGSRLGDDVRRLVADFAFEGGAASIYDLPSQQELCEAASAFSDPSKYNRWWSDKSD